MKLKVSRDGSFFARVSTASTMVFFKPWSEGPI